MADGGDETHDLLTCRLRPQVKISTPRYETLDGRARAEEADHAIHMIIDVGRGGAFLPSFLPRSKYSSRVEWPEMARNREAERERRRFTTHHEYSDTVLSLPLSLSPSPSMLRYRRTQT